MSEVYPLQDRIALVTGASSGLGRHFGLLLAANGAHVALAARSIDRVADTAKVITDQGGKALAVALDVTDRSEEHTSELQSLMRISYAVFCLKKKKQTTMSQHNELIQVRKAH